MKRRFEHHVRNAFLSLWMDTYFSTFNMSRIALFNGVHPNDGNHDECCNDG